MIETRDDLKRYLESDRIALGKTRKHPRPIVDRTWRYQIHYRKMEYYYNNRKRNIIYRILSLIMQFMFVKRSEKLGNELPPNCIAEGLQIWHGQNIILNPNVRIGKNFSISTGCIVGQAKDQCPVIGDNVTLMAHGMILGGVTVADNVRIGAGAVVVKDIKESGTTWVGVPARMIT